MTTEKTYRVAKVTTARPSMNTPEITINGDVIYITDTLNGSFLGGYKIFSDGENIATVGPVTSVDLSTISFPPDSRGEIFIRAIADYFNDSPDSNTVSFYVRGYYELENEFNGQTAVIVSEYSTEINPILETALMVILL